MREEVYRKLIHISTVILPLLVWIQPRPLALAMLVVLAMMALLAEWARLRVDRVRHHFVRYTGTLLRPHEHHQMAGATWMVLAYLLAALLYPKPVAVAAMLYNGLGDASAALVGRRFGRHRTSWGKSWEGAAAALLICFAVGLAVPGVPLAGAVLGAVFAAGLEFLPLPLDDNLRITVGGGFGAWLGWVLA